MKQMVCKRGFSIILVPVVLGLILCFVALVIEFGRILILKHQVQSVADACALAGASVVKTEFDLDEDGKFKFDTINIDIVDELAYEEAEFVFNENMEALGIEAKGVKILEHLGTIDDEKQTFRYEIKASIPMLLGANLLEMKNEEGISIISEAKPTSNDS